MKSYVPSLIIVVHILANLIICRSGTTPSPRSAGCNSPNNFALHCLCPRLCKGKPCGYYGFGPVRVIRCFCDPPCLHEGQCHLNMSSPNGVCRCPPGYSGADCGTLSPEVQCSSLNCQNGGHCKNYGNGSNHCSCPIPFTGKFCETRELNSTERCQQECQKRKLDCKPFIFKDIVVSFECVKHSECQVREGCDHGYCTTNNTNTCICEDCWSGPLCNIRCCKKCLNGGRCILYRGEERCSCSTFPVFYRGDICEIGMPPKSSLTSKLETFCSKKCHDKPCGYYRIGRVRSMGCFCDPPCLYEGQCHMNMSNPNGICRCPPGYSGSDCGTPSPEVQCSSLNCQNGGHCKNYGNGSNICSCPIPFTGKFCETRALNPIERCQRECQKRNLECKPFTFNDTVVSFECVKQSECQVREGCDHGYCTPNNTNTCICEDCWSGPLCNIRCCKKCLNGGRCTVYRGEERCSCPTFPVFYHGDLCEIVYSPESSKLEKFCSKFCPGKPCGYYKSGPVKAMRCFCHPPCLYEGQCHMNLSSPNGVCRCPLGYSGADCGTVSPEVQCSSLNCQNGGHCKNYGNGSNNCSCPIPFTGKFCETRELNSTERCQQECQKRNLDCKPFIFKDTVVSFECVNHSECQVREGCDHGYCTPNNTNTCICEDCWGGPLCNIRCCKKCLNGGRCILYRGEERCSCPTFPVFYRGDLCEIEYSPASKLEKFCSKFCPGKPCGYYKSGPVKAMRCFCHPPCLHEGQCHISLMHPKGVCRCPPGYSGADCGTSSPEVQCSSRDCQNGGHCKNYGNGSNHCSCPIPFTGKFCETRELNSTDRCQQECQKRHLDCKPFTFNDTVMSFECVKPCQVHERCDHGYCIPNNTNPCICEDCWSGPLCNIPCCKKCLNGGRCTVHEGVEKCNCPISPVYYTGDICEDVRTTPVPTKHEVQVPVMSNTYWYIVGACLVVLVLLLALLIILPYILWKKRVLWIMKIVHKLQTPVEDGEKEFDAFVSYSGSKPGEPSSPDELFVLNKLQKKLEKDLNFRLCLHYRDFVPGEAIADNIIHAVEQSHRTILVLSPRYVLSEFCRLEYQKAQHEMLLRRHKIIPIMYEDIAGLDIPDKNLQHILKSITYIEWPGNADNIDGEKKLYRFWKKLEYSMPKKRLPTETNAPGTYGRLDSQCSDCTELSVLELSVDIRENESVLPIHKKQTNCMEESLTNSWNVNKKIKDSQNRAHKSFQKEKNVAPFVGKYTKTIDA